MATRSQHKETRRVCPACGARKLFPERNQTCGCRKGRPPSDKPATADGRPVESLEVSGNLQVVTKLSPKRITSLADLLEFCEVDPVEWEVDRYTVNKWEVGAGVVKKDGTKRVKVTPLFQVKVWLKRRADLVQARDILADFKADAAKHAPVYAPYVKKHPPSGNMLEIHVPDLHLGKLAWSKETGYEDYDCKLAQDVYEQAMHELVERSRRYEYDELIMSVGNDLFQADNYSNRTTAGTYVSTDGRYQKTFRQARQMVVHQIDRLATVAPKRKVIIVPGNHDEETSWHLGENLSIWYRNNPDVEVDNSPTARKYHRFGRVGLMFLHGHQGKHADYGLLFATERPDVFGPKGSFREIHTGHLHQLRVSERFGVRTRIVNSLGATDKWHADAAYVGMLRAAEAFHWNEKLGLLGIAEYCLPEAE
jgi:hypothetical protein